MMMTYKLLTKLSLAPAWLWDWLWSPIWKRAMRHCGKGVYLRPMSSDIKGVENLSIGDGTSIPKGSTLYCTEAPLTIGKKVIFGPNPTIITGDHRIDLVGKYIIDVTVDEKLPENDAPVVIEDDVWCGANVTILKGVTIGHGSVVAAGAVVTQSFPPYSIIGGVPARLIRRRFTEEEAKENDRLLNGNDEGNGNDDGNDDVNGNDKRKVMIVAPSLDTLKNVSGVSTVADFIISHNKECEYEHFLQGKGDGKTGTLDRVLRVWRSYRHWKGLLKERDNQMIHYNYPLDTPSIVRDFFFLRYARMKKKKMVIHVHGGLYLFKEKKPFVIRRILNEVFSWECPFIVLSNKEKERIQSDYRTKNVFVLPNCVDVPDDNVNDNLNDNGLHILYLGRIEPKKGMDYLFEAMKELRKEERMFTLHFAGVEQGGQDYINRFQKLLGERFVYEGVVSGEQKTELMRRCQVFVLPSLYEGLPMSLLECMSYGIVPVVTNVGSIEEYVKDGENGLLMKVKDAGSIVESLKRLHDKTLLHKMSLAARQTILDNFQPQKYIERLNQIYAKA